jgi:hypothetical protein
MTTEEQLLLGKIEADFYAEIGRRTESEREFLTEKYNGYTDDELWDAFLENWLERLGQETAMAEFRVAQLSYAARVCEGVHIDADEWDHAECNGHEERMWTSYAEVRSLPEDLTHEPSAPPSTSSR